jgi:hypothetical protein
MLKGEATWSEAVLSCRDFVALIIATGELKGENIDVLKILVTFYWYMYTQSELLIQELLFIGE